MILPRCHAATLPADLEPEPDVELQRSNVADACRHNIEVAKSLGCPQVTLQGMTLPPFEEHLAWGTSLKHH